MEGVYKVLNLSFDGHTDFSLLMARQVLRRCTQCWGSL